MALSKKLMVKNRLWLLFIIIVLFSVSVTAAQNKVVVIPLFGDEQTAIEDLRARIAVLEEKLAYMSIESGTNNNLTGPHVVFTGVNVHIRSGSGETYDNHPQSPLGLGNLIVGYNELHPMDNPPDNNRTGSHNIVVGPRHNFTSWGGLVAGMRNTISGSGASVSGGNYNTASGATSSVSGGSTNTARGGTSSVSGGNYNTASGATSSVSGGTYNTASGPISSVSGGSHNTASAYGASVSGGNENTASGSGASVLGSTGVTASNEDEVRPYPCYTTWPNVGWCK